MIVNFFFLKNVKTGNMTRPKIALPLDKRPLEVYICRKFDAGKFFFRK